MTKETFTHIGTSQLLKLLDWAAHRSGISRSLALSSSHPATASVSSTSINYGAATRRHASLALSAVCFRRRRKGVPRRPRHPSAFAATLTTACRDSADSRRKSKAFSPDWLESLAGGVVSTAAGFAASSASANRPPATKREEPATPKQNAPRRAVATTPGKKGTPGKKLQGWQAWWQVLKTTFADWSEDKAPRLGAALSYYTIFSLAPLLLLALAIAAFVFGEDAARGRIDQELQGFLGTEGAAAVQEMITHARKPGAGLMASTIGIVFLLFGASGVFAQLKDALNTIWEVAPKPGRGWLRTVKDRFLSFAMVLCIGFLLLVSLVVSTALSAVASWTRDVLPGPDVLFHVANALVSLAIITMLFALIFKYLPDVKIAWKDVWLGAVATAVLFTAGKFLFGLYLGRGTIGSTYGAAGAVIVVLLWAYYSSQILFLGAEFTQAYAKSFGSRIEPAPGAMAVTQEARSQQGMTPIAGA